MDMLPERLRLSLAMAFKDSLFAQVGQDKSVRADEIAVQDRNIRTDRAVNSDSGTSMLFPIRYMRSDLKGPAPSRVQPKRVQNGSLTSISCKLLIY
jgi:hypothetical protein